MSLSNDPGGLFSHKEGYRPHHASLKGPHLALTQAGSPAPPSSKVQSVAQQRGPAIDPVKAMKANLESVSTPLAKAGIVKEALAQAKNDPDPKMAQKVTNAALGHEKTSAPDRAEIIGTMMMNGQDALVMGAPKEALNFDGADLRGVSLPALQVLPYNKMKAGAKFPANLDLKNNAHMSGAVLDGAQMASAILGENADRIKSANGMDLGHQAANQTTATLSLKGGNVKNMQAAWGYNPSASQSVMQIKPDGTAAPKQQKNWARISTSPSMGV